jgi:hypothetical protein
MIGVIVDGMSTLKILQPIMQELHKAGHKYVLYHSAESKRHNNPTIGNMKKSSPGIVKRAKRTKIFGSKTKRRSH